MKLFLAFLQSRETYPIPAYHFWQDYLKKGIEESGHDWTESPEADWALGLVPKTAAEQEAWRSAIWERTLAQLRADPPDLFLSYLYPEQIDAGALREIRKIGIPCVNFFCDHVRLFDRLPVELECFDLSWVPEYAALRLYDQRKAARIHRPMPVWVDPHYRRKPVAENEEISFCGSADIQRRALLSRVVQYDPELPLAIYGRGWKADAASAAVPAGYGAKLVNQLTFILRFGASAWIRKLSQRGLGPEHFPIPEHVVHENVSDAKYLSVLRDSKITLGINRYPGFKHPFDRPGTYSRLRDIEAPMLGSCYLTEWTEGLDQLYDCRDEIAVYRDAEELFEQIRRLERSPAERAKLRTGGQARALTEHTIPATIGAILNKLTR